MSPNNANTLTFGSSTSERLRGRRWQCYDVGQSTSPVRIVSVVRLMHVQQFDYYATPIMNDKPFDFNTPIHTPTERRPRGPGSPPQHSSEKHPSPFPQGQNGEVPHDEDPINSPEASEALEGDIRRRFWDNVDVRRPNECWPWTGYTDRDGYGRMSVSGRKRQAHRIAYRLKYRDRPPVVMHRCDNPPCCNPLHLKGGTQGENVRDKVRKDRQAKGSANGRAKLTEDQVVEIKRLLRAGDISQAEIARTFRISKSVIRDIRRGRTWRHVELS